MGHHAETTDCKAQRVTRCLRTRISGTSEIPIMATNGKAHYSNLQLCGSVWSCPVCAAKIAEVRRGELRHAVDTHLAGGGRVVMVTLTFPHYKRDKLEVLLDQFKSALQKLKGGRKYEAFKAAIGYLGSIRAIEVTYGENGWHPHAHELWFLPPVLDDYDSNTQLQADLLELWRHAALKAGFPAPSVEHGCHVQDAESAAEYIAKFGCEPSWEIARELVNANTKHSRDQKGMTPFDLLRHYLSGETSAPVRFLANPAQAGQLFVEYATAFFGTEQLYWSKGMKARFNIAKISDEEAVQESDDVAIEITTLNIAQWRSVLYARYETRGIVLQIAENGGHAAVHSFISTLKVAPKSRPKKSKCKPLDSVRAIKRA